MSQLIPVGMFELYIFRLSDDPSKYAVEILSPEEFAQNIEAWVEAAACLTSFVARHSNLGYEKILELVTAKSMIYRDGPPPNLPKPPADTDTPDLPIATD